MSHIDICARLGDSLSISQQQSPHGAELQHAIRSACERWPEIDGHVDWIPPRETFRRWLWIIRWRLEQTLAVELEGAWPEGAYGAPLELTRDVELAQSALEASGNKEIADAELRTWLDQIRIFGFHTARLDIRQHAAVYREVMDDMWEAARLIPPGTQLHENSRRQLLIDTLEMAPNIDPIHLNDTSRETLQLFTHLRRLARRYGMASLGGHVISMTTAASDLLTVLWLWKWSERVDGGDERDDDLRLPIVPLLETIDDLTGAVDIITTALDTPAYRHYLTRLGDTQMVMIGYSDSTKDGGYLSAGWALYRAQIELYETAAKRDVELTFFHGRGGSLGRGGGPAARAILSLPSNTFHGSLRLTEQGEVLAERYDDPDIAHRHLEQVVWSVMMAATHRASHVPPEWFEAMDDMAAVSLEAYRKLVDHPGFVEFFRRVTPIGEIERLPIGSRPSRRKGDDRIENLRAIPWVFAWTQSRCLIPAWYGVGAGLKAILSQPGGDSLLQYMYQNWLFFSATIDNSLLALAKSNMPVFRRYMAVAGDDPAMREVGQMMIDEFGQASETILAVTGTEKLLDSTPWLQRSIQVRNRYVDPLNLVQVELLRRRQRALATGEGWGDSLEELSQLTIKGIAAGMRTTG